MGDREQRREEKRGDEGVKATEGSLVIYWKMRKTEDKEDRRQKGHID
jgi:hypothetical protein